MKFILISGTLNLFIAGTLKFYKNFLKNFNAIILIHIVNILEMLSLMSFRIDRNTSFSFRTHVFRTFNKQDIFQEHPANVTDIQIKIYHNNSKTLQKSLEIYGLSNKSTWKKEECA